MARQKGADLARAKHATQKLCALIVVTGLAVTSATGCARRAPGPDECHDLAVAWVLGVRAARAAAPRVGPAASQAILDRTTTCLTTPYDKQVVQCVTGGSNPRTCMLSFESRHAHGSGQLQP